MAAGRLARLRGSRAFIAAAICGIVSYSMMNLVMTSAPLAMRICGLSLTDSNFGIQWRIVAMYGPSFFTGSLIAHFGASAVVATGLALVVLETHRPQERNKVQAFNDFLVFGGDRLVLIRAGARQLRLVDRQHGGVPTCPDRLRRTRHGWRRAPSGANDGGRNS